MKRYRPGLPTEEVMAGLRDAIRRSDHASVHVVLWLSEVIERDLYRERGCLSPHQFVREKCGFSASRTSQMLRLARMSAELAPVRDALASGRLGWTNLRVLAPVLTRSNAPRWVAIAEGLSRRALERRIAAARCRSRDEVREAKGEPVQLRVPDATGVPAAADPTAPGSRVGGGTGSGGVGDDPASSDAPGCISPLAPPQEATGKGREADEGGPGRAPSRSEAPDVSLERGGPAVAVPLTVTLRLEPLQLARLEVLLDRLRRQGHRGSREEVLLAALELAAGGASGADGAGGAGRAGNPGGPGEPPSRAPGSRYQIVIAECPSCRERRVAASDRPLDPATAEAVGCDAERVDGQGRRRSAIPPSVRRRVLARDGHRCRAPGCGRRTLLEIHHRVPVSRGGTHDPSNLVTLCHGCHQALHAMHFRGAAADAPGCSSSQSGSGGGEPHPRSDRSEPHPRPGGRESHSGSGRNEPHPGSGGKGAIVAAPPLASPVEPELAARSRSPSPATGSHAARSGAGSPGRVPAPG